MAIQDRLEQRIGKLLDCLENKGALSAEDRAAIGIVPLKTIDSFTLRGALWLAVIIAAGVTVLVALLFFYAVRT